MSRVVAETVRADVGETIELRLGDGTLVTPRVVAIYEYGLGFGMSPCPTISSSPTPPRGWTARC
ncbi:hypothetical protein NKG94_22400 [Micromonospora sp. M12]